MEAPPKAFVMFLPIDTPGNCLDKIGAWGTKRFTRFKVSQQEEQRDLLVAGGFVSTCFGARKAARTSGAS